MHNNIIKWTVQFNKKCVQAVQSVFINIVVSDILYNNTILMVQVSLHDPTSWQINDLAVYVAKPVVKASKQRC